MHEYSITDSMLKEVLSQADEHGAKRVTRIKLLVGEAAGVVPECVQFYFDVMKQGTIAQDAKLEFERVGLRLRCPKCGAEFGSIDDMCDCNAGAEFVSGQEMVIESIEIEDEKR